MKNVRAMVVTLVKRGHGEAMLVLVGVVVGGALGGGGLVLASG